MSQPPCEPPDALRRDYAGDYATLRSARREVVEFLAQQGADEETRERAALIVSELTSNAIQASPGLVYNLEVVRVDDTAAISVRNRPAGQFPPPREHWRPPKELSLRELSPRGRGLSIVESLSDELTIEHEGDEIIITARLRLDVDRK